MSKLPPPPEPTFSRTQCTIILTAPRVPNLPDLALYHQTSVAFVHSTLTRYLDGPPPHWCDDVQLISDSLAAFNLAQKELKP